MKRQNMPVRIRELAREYRTRDADELEEVAWRAVQMERDRVLEVLDMFLAGSLIQMERRHALVIKAIRNSVANPEYEDEEVDP